LWPVAEEFVLYRSLDGSALYAIPFNLTETRNVNIDFYSAIDNSLGDPMNSGLFVNSAAISGTNSDVWGFVSVNLLSRDITPYVVPGLNYLYVYQYDEGGASGSRLPQLLPQLPNQPRSRCTTQMEVRF